jgi:hypothetical protein
LLLDKMWTSRGGRRDIMVITTSPGATVRALTRDDMLRERDELLAESGMTEEELRALGAAWKLDAHHRGLLSRIDGLDFLLDNTPAA